MDESMLRLVIEASKNAGSNNPEKSKSLRNKLLNLRKNTDKIFNSNWIDKADGHKLRKIVNVGKAEWNTCKEYKKQMSSETNFNSYKRKFDKVCDILGIPKKDCVITKLIFNETAKTFNIAVEYALSPSKIVIPSKTPIYHKSSNGDISNLKPTFKSKNGYFYSSLRVYLTINPSMSSISADMGLNKLSTYVIKENIQTAHPDPLLPSHQGAVYVDTSFPISITKIKKGDHVNV